MSRIRLDQAEADYIIKQANEVLARSKDFKDYGVGSTRFARHAIGFAGEYAVSKYLYQNKPTFDLESRHDGDAGSFEVRTTQKRDGRLILNERDLPKADRIFILVRSLKDLWFEIVGWLYGHEIMRPENIFERPQFKETIWRVENRQLRPIKEVPGVQDTHTNWNG